MSYFATQRKSDSGKKTKLFLPSFDVANCASNGWSDRRGRNVSVKGNSSLHHSLPHSPLVLPVFSPSLRRHRRHAHPRRRFAMSFWKDGEESSSEELSYTSMDMDLWVCFFPLVWVWVRVWIFGFSFSDPPFCCSPQG